MALARSLMHRMSQRVPMQYSATVLKHFRKPSNVGRLDDANAVGQAGAPGQGNYMLLNLRIEGSRIVKAAFQTFGCPAAIASGSMLTELVTGATIEDATRITGKTVLEALEYLPFGREQCADLAAGALRDALSHYTGACSR